MDLDGRFMALGFPPYAIPVNGAAFHTHFQREGRALKKTDFPIGQ